MAASRASTSSSCAESALPEEESCAAASATQITAVVSSAAAAASLPVRADVSKPDRAKVFIVNLPGRQPVGPAGSAMQPQLQSVHHPCAAPPHASAPAGLRGGRRRARRAAARQGSRQDRKSTRLNSSHVAISYDVFCLKK